MTKHYKYIVFLLFISLFNIQIIANDKPNIGVVDIDSILDKSLAVQDINKQVAKLQDQFQKDQRKMDNKLRSEDEVLAKKQGQISDTEFDKELQKFRLEVEKAQQDFSQRRNKLEQAYGDAVNKVQEASSVVIADIAKERNLIIIVPTSQILYNDPSLDFSDEVLKRLNKKMNKVQVDYK